MKILAIIPARSNSKSIIHKNIRLLNNKPLLVYSIEHGQSSLFINRIILSTDNIEYGIIGKKYGAEVPFMRPVCISDDLSTDLEVFNHALTWLKKFENYTPEICVQLRPTYPYRNPKDIDSMIKLLIDNPEYDSVRSITKANENPFKMWTINSNGSISPVVKKINNINEPYNEPRQKLLPAYIQNAAIDVFWTKTVLEKKSMTGDKIYGYIMDHNYDIDYEQDFINAERIVNYKKK
jgi:CMP-N,N'-diacetyllegionaminic acid synthase